VQHMSTSAFASVSFGAGSAPEQSDKGTASGWSSCGGPAAAACKPWPAGPAAHARTQTTRRAGSSGHTRRCCHGCPSPAHRGTFLQEQSGGTGAVNSSNGSDWPCRAATGGRRAPGPHRHTAHHAGPTRCLCCAWGLTSPARPACGWCRMEHSTSKIH
jgi:hypothetical protein